MFPPRELGGRYRMLHLDFYVDAGDLNLGLDAHTAGALPTEPSPWPSLRAVPIQSGLILLSVTRLSRRPHPELGVSG